MKLFYFNQIDVIGIERYYRISGPLEDAISIKVKLMGTQ